MSKSRSFFAFKPWITTAIANSIKSKTKIYKTVCNRKKKLNQKKFIETSLKLTGTTLLRYQESQRINITKLILKKIKKIENLTRSYYKSNSIGVNKQFTNW